MEINLWREKEIYLIHSSNSIWALELDGLSSTQNNLYLKTKIPCEEAFDLEHFEREAISCVEEDAAAKEETWHVFQDTIHH